MNDYEDLQVDLVTQIPKGYSGYVWIKDDYFATYPDKDAPDGRMLQRIESAYNQQGYDE